ncbi:MAG: hypothetical protein QM666_09615, partial [Acinetobacter sp.]
LHKNNTMMHADTLSTMNHALSSQNTRKKKRMMAIILVAINVLLFSLLLSQILLYNKRLIQHFPELNAVTTILCNLKHCSSSIDTPQ